MVDESTERTEIGTETSPSQSAEHTHVKANLFGQAIGRFITNVDSLASTLPLAMNAIAGAQKLSEEKYQEFLNRHSQGQDGEKRELLIPPDQWLRFHKLMGRRRKMRMAFRTVPNSFLVSLVSQFDEFLGDLVEAIFESRPEMLTASERSLTYGTLLGFSSLDDARAYLIEKEVESVLRKNHAEQFDWLENKLGIPLRKGLDSWPEFIEVTERRNLLVHTGGVVSSQYLVTCKAHAVALPSDLVLGKTLRVSRSYFDLAYECLFEIAVKLVNVVWRKLQPDECKRSDTQLLNTCYELLEDERYELARRLGDFATCVLKHHSSDDMRRRLVVNRAQAYKWLGKKEKALEIMAAEDWTASSDTFRLADAVIHDDFERAAAYMERAGKKEDKSSYRDWPLFKEFRKTEAFLRTYEAVFGEAFNVAAPPPVLEEQDTESSRTDERGAAGGSASDG